MARPLIADRVKETTLTTGTGQITLAGNEPGFFSFAESFPSGSPVYYLIADNPTNTTQFELGVGTFTAGTPNKLSRDTVQSSSNGGSLVNFTAGGVVTVPYSAYFLRTITDSIDSDTVTTGTSTAYSVTTYRPDASLYEGRFVCFKLHTTCGASPTLNVGGLGAKALVDLNGTPIASGAMVKDAYYWCKYDATNTRWMVFSPFGLKDAAYKSLGADIVDDGSGNLTRRIRLLGRATDFSFTAAGRGTRNIFIATGKTGVLLDAATAGYGWNADVEDYVGGNVISSPAANLAVNGVPGLSAYTFSQGEFAQIACDGVAYYVTTNKPAASTSAPGAVQKATTAQVKAETADRYPDAAGLKYHPAVAKAWVRFDGATGNIIAGYNVASVARPSQGNYTVNFANAMANANYAIMVSCSLRTDRQSTSAAIGAPASITTSGFPVTIKTQDGATTRTEDAPIVTAIVFGS